MAATAGKLSIPVEKAGLAAAMHNAHGLVVGIANYLHLNPLPRTVLKDAEDMRNVLVDSDYCAYPDENVELLLDGDATQANLRKAMSRLARRCDEDSIVFFYISSHGCSIESGRLAGEYILTVDTREDKSDDPDESLVQSAISGTEFSQMLRAIPARKLVAVLDCCHAGGIGQPKERGARNLQAVRETYYQDLARGSGRVILASSRSNEVSYVLPRAPNSLFTQYLLQGLKGGVPGPGPVIRILDLFSHLQPKVTKDCAKQHPILKAEVEENFPIALYLGGKGLSTGRRAGNRPTDHEAPLEGPAWIMHQLQLLFGSDDHLLERDHKVLFDAFQCELSRADGDHLPQIESEYGDDVKQVVSWSRQSSSPAIPPPGSVELLSALLRIGLRLNLCRQGIARRAPLDPGLWSRDQWLAYLTEEIACERGVICFSLLLPDENWIKPLIGATAIAMENLWQQVRSVLTRNRFSFAVTRPQFTIDTTLPTIPPAVLNEISKAAEEAEKSWPAFPHFGAQPELPALEELLPLPESNIDSPVVFAAPDGFAARLLVDGSLVADSGEEQVSKFEYWPATESPAECILTCNQGGGIFVPVTYSRVRRLYSVETVALQSAVEQVDMRCRLGLKNNLLQSLWPKVLANQATSYELVQVVHILRDARDVYQGLCRRMESLSKRRDLYWDTMEIIRKRIRKEGESL